MSDTRPPFVCVICRKQITDQWGNNPQPVLDGKCCDECNEQVVIPTRRRRLRFAGMTLIALCLLPFETRAQQTTVYGADGRAVSRTVTGSDGSTTTYDAATGRAIARTTTSPTTGTTTVYGADGNKAGSIVPERGRK